jgi:hypothetical protein
MTDHLRTQIRDQVATTITGLSLTGSNVFVSRVYPVASDKLPGLLVYTISEQVTTRTISLPRTQERALDVAVEAHVKAVDTFDDTLDEITAQVEEAVMADVTLGGLVKDTRLTSVNIQMSGDGDQPVCVASMSFSVMYTMKEDNPRGV